MLPVSGVVYFIYKEGGGGFVCLDTVNWSTIESNLRLIIHGKQLNQFDMD